MFELYILNVLKNDNKKYMLIFVNNKKEKISFF